jgi:hypothetical protein
MAQIRRIVLDVLQSHDPSTLELTQQLADIDGIAGVNAAIVDVDRDVQTVKFTIEGENIEFSAVKSTVETLGASVHSIDQVVSGERLVEEITTPQDRQ